MVSNSRNIQFTKPGAHSLAHLCMSTCTQHPRDGKIEPLGPISNHSSVKLEHCIDFFPPLPYATAEFSRSHEGAIMRERGRVTDQGER